MLVALTKKQRGRPATLKTPSANAGFSSSIDVVEAHFAISGHPEPRKAAFENARTCLLDEGESPSEETLQSYYFKGLADRKDENIAFARSINTLAAAFPTTFRGDPIEAAIAGESHGDLERHYVCRLNYDRGARALKRRLKPENK